VTWSGVRPAIDVTSGTKESTWDSSGVLDQLPPFPIELVERAIVVAPHPDDEVLALGGTMSLLAGAGADLELIAVTDGEGSHPGSMTVTRAELHERRPLETLAAIERLDVTFTYIHRLHVPDGKVRSHEEYVTEAIERCADPTTWIFAPWRFDGHPDHEASGRAAAAASRSSGAHLVEYLVWAWNCTSPGDGAVPWCDARSIALPPHLRRVKVDAIGEFRSQIEAFGGDPPVLPADVLAHFGRPFETVLVQ
jgi:LmbE family N-acetylglucosaminyl deacetylase